jgi:hypothetical protein
MFRRFHDFNVLWPYSPKFPWSHAPLFPKPHALKMGLVSFLVLDRKVYISFNDVNLHECDFKCGLLWWETSATDFE